MPVLIHSITFFSTLSSSLSPPSLNPSLFFSSTVCLSLSLRLSIPLTFSSGNFKHSSSTLLPLSPCLLYSTGVPSALIGTQQMLNSCCGADRLLIFACSASNPLDSLAPCLSLSVCLQSRAGQILSCLSEPVSLSQSLLLGINPTTHNTHTLSPLSAVAEFWFMLPMVHLKFWLLHVQAGL